MKVSQTRALICVLAVAVLGVALLLLPLLVSRLQHVDQEPPVKVSDDLSCRVTLYPVRMGSSSAFPAGSWDLSVEQSEEARALVRDLLAHDDTDIPYVDTGPQDQGEIHLYDPAQPDEPLIRATFCRFYGIIVFVRGKGLNKRFEAEPELGERIRRVLQRAAVEGKPVPGLKEEGE